MHQDDSHPVVCISWDHAQAYCAWLGRETGQCYGLLTEAQWEQACRAGGQGRWSFGDDEARLGDCAWYAGNATDGTHPVGEKAANAWQLHDMHGHVWEWCADWLDQHTYRRRTAPTDGAAASRGDHRGDAAAGHIVESTGPETGSLRVVRGGAWHYDADYCRSACRYAYEPSNRNYNLGFRLSRTVWLGTLTLLPLAGGSAAPGLSHRRIDAVPRLHPPVRADHRALRRHVRPR